MEAEKSDVQESQIESEPQNDANNTSNDIETDVNEIKSEEQNTQSTDEKAKCEVCDATYDASVNHLDDLCHQIVTKGGEAVKQMTTHWPHFISSQIMQIYCSSCSIHLKTFRDLLIHFHLLKTEAGYKSSCKSLPEWNEELGKSHAENYTSLVATLKELTGDINTYHIGLMKPYLCKYSPRYYEIAYMSGSYEDTKSPIVENTDLKYTERLAKVLGESEEEYALVESDNIDRSKEIEQIFFPKKENEAESTTISNGKPPIKKPQINIFKCLKCSDLFPNVKRHIVSAMWQMKKPCNDRVRHWAFFFGSDIVKIENFAERGNALMCPVCHMHIFRRGIWGFISLFDHLLDNAIPKKHLTNKLANEHKDLLIFLTDLTVDMVKGDINSEEAINSLQSKFTCSEGSSYMLGKHNLLNSNPGVKRNNEQKNQNAAKKPRNDAAQKRGGRKVKEFYARKAQQHQQPRGPTALPPAKQHNPHPPKAVGNSRIQPVACDLCDYKCGSLDHLRDHLRQCLFSGNQLATEAHLTCFSKMMVFNQNCACPACGCYQINLLNCMQHIGLMANNREKSHVGTINMILEQYMKCMTRVVSLQAVTSWFQKMASMRW